MRNKTTSIPRPAPPTAADEGRSRLGDLTRPIPVDKRISRRPNLAVVAGIAMLLVIVTIVAAIFVLPISTWRDQDADLRERQAQLEELERVNGELAAEVERLGTEDGIREAAGEEIGYLEPGERRLSVLTMPELPRDLPDGWPYNIAAQILSVRTAPPPPAGSD